MAFVSGASTVSLVDGYNLTTFFKTVTPNLSRAALDTTTMGTGGARTSIPGLRGGSLSLEGLFDAAPDGIDEVLSAAFVASVRKVVTIGPAGLARGSRVWIVSADESGYEVSSPLDGVVQSNAEFQSSNGLGLGLAVTDFGALAGASNLGLTAVDFGAASSLGARAHLHVTAPLSGFSFNPKLQHSVDNSTWVDVPGGAFTILTARGVSAVEIASGVTLNRYVRLFYTLTGAVVTASVSLARN